MKGSQSAENAFQVDGTQLRQRSGHHAIEFGARDRSDVLANDVVPVRHDLPLVLCFLAAFSGAGAEAGGLRDCAMLFSSASRMFTTGARCSGACDSTTCCPETLAAMRASSCSR